MCKQGEEKRLKVLVLKQFIGGVSRLAVGNPNTLLSIHSKELIKAFTEHNRTVDSQEKNN